MKMLRQSLTPIFKLHQQTPQTFMQNYLKKTIECKNFESTSADLVTLLCERQLKIESQTAELVGFKAQMKAINKKHQSHQKTEQSK